MNALYSLPGGDVAVLGPHTPFPPIETALIEPNGLLAIGGDLSVPRLLDAYGRGIFPWRSAGDPLLWWTPNPRCVLFPEEFRPSRSLLQRLRKNEFELRCDTRFQAVIEACAKTPRPGQKGTWIGADMVDAYSRLHAAGHAHSVETWRDGKLVGGLYGVAVGCVFFGESMFHHATDASKIALAALVSRLRAHGFGLIDCQMHTAHLARLGARTIARADFATRLAGLTRQTARQGTWDTPWSPHDLAS